MKFRLAGFLLMSCFVGSVAIADPLPLINAHAHNDYEHRRPLFDALDHGFCSVEADIYLVNGQLLVAHNRSDVRKERTLQALYLEPLRKLAKGHNGKVFGHEPRFFLLIDVKSDFATTYPVLRKVLASYSDLLTQWKLENGKVETTTNAVTAVITGNYSVAVIEREKTRFAGIDGRIKDLQSTNPNDSIVWISDSWKSFCKWNGRNEISEKDRAFVRDAAKRAHANGKLLRFWATPDTTAAWKEFQQDGVDLLNADDLDGLEKFLLANPYPGTMIDAPSPAF
jgi:hypothetical protein